MPSTSKWPLADKRSFVMCHLATDDVFRDNTSVLCLLFASASRVLIVQQNIECGTIVRKAEFML